MIRVAFLAVVVAGCSSSSDEQAEVVQEVGCPSCTNSPVIDSYECHDLQKWGTEYNAQGFRILGFLRPLTPTSFQALTLDVQRGKLSGTYGTTTYSGAGLTGLVLVLGHTNGNRYAVKIEDVGTADYYAKLPGAKSPLPTVETLYLTWSLWNSGPLPTANYARVCQDIGLDDQELMGMGPSWATVYEGDRISSDTYADEGINTDWFNIGCAGHVIAKLALTGHTHAAQSDGFDTTLDERTSMIKMFSADYCGVGHPFTVPGTPLAWMDDHGWMDMHDDADEVEALWGPRGALCMNTPRCDDAATCEDLTASATIAAQVKELCGLPPPCNFGVEAHLTSANF